MNASSLACQVCAPGSYSPAAGAVACTVNPAGFASKTETYFSSSMALPGATTLGASQNATLATAVASALGVAADSVVITGVGSTADARRRLAAAAATANFTVATTNTTLAAQVRTTLNSTATFAAVLTTALKASPDPVLSAVTSITVAAPVENSQVLSSEACQPGTFLNSRTTSCEACAWNLVSLSVGAVSCVTCPFTSARANASYCQPCPENSKVATSNPGQCACSNGYYDTLYGSDLLQPACMACPFGGVCDTGFVAAAAGFWRETTRSDVFYRCREGKCLAEVVIGPLSLHNGTNATSSAGRRLLQLGGGGSNATNSSAEPTNCVEGAAGPLCAICLPGYALQSGECLPCNPDDAWENWSSGSKTGLLVGVMIAAIIIILFAFFQPLLPAVERFANAVVDAVKSCFSATKSRITCGMLDASKEAAKNDKKASDADADAPVTVVTGTAPLAHPPASVPAADAAHADQSAGRVLRTAQQLDAPTRFDHLLQVGASSVNEGSDAHGAASVATPADTAPSRPNSATQHSRPNTATHHQRHSRSGVVHHAQHDAALHGMAANAAFAAGMMSAAIDDEGDLGDIGGEVRAMSCFFVQRVQHRVCCASLTTQRTAGG